jgi:hypothetical protein
VYIYQRVIGCDRSVDDNNNNSNMKKMKDRKERKNRKERKDRKEKDRRTSLSAQRKEKDMRMTKEKKKQKICFISVIFNCTNTSELRHGGTQSLSLSLPASYALDFYKDFGSFDCF